MRKLFSKKEKGTAGLEIFLAIIVMIFMIGMIVMVFAVANTKLMAEVDDAQAKDVINDTLLAISDAPNWFGIFIVMGALVVLVLMVVLIISAIKQSGVAGGGMGG